MQNIFKLLLRTRQRVLSKKKVLHDLQFLVESHTCCLQHRTRPANYPISENNSSSPGPKASGRVTQKQIEYLSRSDQHLKYFYRLLQIFHPSLLRLVNNCVESIYKTQKTRTTVLPSEMVSEWLCSSVCSSGQCRL